MSNEGTLIAHENGVSGFREWALGDVCGVTFCIFRNMRYNSA